MKELKFRGISLDTNKMVYGYGVVALNKEAIIIHKQGINLMHHTAVKHDSVGQYIRSINGVEIYTNSKIIFSEEDTKPLYFIVWDEEECEYILRSLIEDNLPLRLWYLLTIKFEIE